LDKQKRERAIKLSERRLRLQRVFLDELEDTPEDEREFVCEEFLEDVSWMASSEVNAALVKYLEPDLR
jgi:hypothetical protein